MPELVTLVFTWPSPGSSGRVTKAGGTSGLLPAEAEPLLPHQGLSAASPPGGICRPCHDLVALGTGGHLLVELDSFPALINTHSKVHSTEKDVWQSVVKARATSLSFHTRPLIPPHSSSRHTMFPVEQLCQRPSLQSGQRRESATRERRPWPQ